MTLSRSAQWPIIPSRLPSNLPDLVSSSRILVVGSGGIGCELIKTMALSGFKKIDLIDLDTIEVSNLNRQFLFRRNHVGQSKAKVARDAIVRIVPDIEINAHHANIMESRFNASSYIPKFDCVINALDNIEARKHVNRLCLAANVPIVETGSAGYLGQATIQMGGVSECFECTPPTPPTKFPVCTIRNTPDKPIHCIVWAKYLFGLLFGPAAEDNLLSDDHNDDSSTSNTSPIDLRLQPDENPTDYAKRVFNKIFIEDIRASLSYEDRWRGRLPPIALDSPVLCDFDNPKEEQSPDSSTAFNSQVIPNEMQCRRSFLVVIASRLVGQRQHEIGNMIFDKDDQDAVVFVAAAANLRSFNFHIPRQSSFQAVSMAGNIIPAIATTNAIIAGLAVMETFKVVSGTEYVRSLGKTVYCSDQPSCNRLLIPSDLSPPNANCFICGSKQISIVLDVKKTTLKTFIESVLQKLLGFRSPSVSVGGSSWYTGDDGDLDEEDMEQNNRNTLKLLCDISIIDGTVIDITEEAESLQVEDKVNCCTVCIVHLDSDEWNQEKFSDCFAILKNNMTRDSFKLDSCDEGPSKRQKLG